MNTSSGLLMPCVTLSTTIRLENMCVLGRVSLAEGEGETIVPSEAPPRRPPALPDSLTRLEYKIRRFGARGIRPSQRKPGPFGCPISIPS